MTTTASPATTYTDEFRDACMPLNNTIGKLQEKYPAPKCDYSVKSMFVVEKLLPVSCPKCDTKLMNNSKQTSQGKYGEL